MKLTTFSTVILVKTVAALPQFVPSSGAADTNVWQASGEGDLRAPWPGINTLANHDYINRNGRHITVDDFDRGFLEAFGMAYDTTTPGAVNAMNLSNPYQDIKSPEKWKDLVSKLGQIC